MQNTKLIAFWGAAVKYQHNNRIHSKCLQLIGSNVRNKFRFCRYVFCVLTEVVSTCEVGALSFLISNSNANSVSETAIIKQYVDATETLWLCEA